MEDVLLKIIFDISLSHGMKLISSMSLANPFSINPMAVTTTGIVDVLRSQSFYISTSRSMYLNKF